MFTTQTRNAKLRKPATIRARSERAVDQQRKRLQRRADKNVHIPVCDDRQRRERLEADDEEWLYYYAGPDSGLPEPFTYRFVEQQREMISLIGHACRTGGDQALAASRGEGKTSLFRYLLAKYALQGVVSCAVLFAATATDAGDSLEAIKYFLASTDLVWRDYPEICVPIRALENTPSRAHFQVVTGFRHENGEPFYEHPSKFSWCGQQVTFPDVPGAPGRSAIIATRGLESAVRGLNKLGRRPQLAGIDDPDTTDTMLNPDQAAKLETRIEKSIGGLGGQKRPIARVMLCTCASEISVAYRFTDPKIKPSWKGQRYRWLIKPPDRIDLWDTYVDLCRQAMIAVADKRGNDVECREAHQFLLENREAMHAGAVVANENRYDTTILADGTQREISALQRYFNEVVRIGEDAVETEYNNNPPITDQAEADALTPHRVQQQRGGFERGVVPPDALVLVQGIDVGKRALHWVVRAFTRDYGFTIDAGIQEVRGTHAGTDEGVDVAIARALDERAEDLISRPYCTPDGQPVDVSLSLVDSRYMQQAVFSQCLRNSDISGQEWLPALGFGRSGSTVGRSFRARLKPTASMKPGEGFYLEKRNSKPAVWICCMDTDRWKRHEHARWLTAPHTAGAMHIWGGLNLDRTADRRERGETHSYAHHVTNEREAERIVKGQLVRIWEQNGGNHWLDASYMAHVAAAIRGVVLGGRALAPLVVTPAQRAKEHQPAQRPTLAQLQAAAHAR